MSWELWWLFVVMDTAMSFSPGPAVLLVLSQGLGPGFRASIAANLGILSGNLVWFTLSAAGLSALIVAWPQVFEVVRWLGVGYLCWMGGAMLLGHHNALRTRADPQRRSFLRGWLQGVALQLANPKAIVFFGALLPPFVDVTRPVALQMVILAVTSVVIEFWILVGYGALAARAADWAAQPAVARRIDHLAGSLLIAAALLTATIGLT